jgi:hypothetical protein
VETTVTVVLWIAGAILLYLALGHLLDRVVVPEPAVELSSSFTAGDVSASDMEKLRQIVTRQESGRVYWRIELEPHAPGLPSASTGPLS